MAKLSSAAQTIWNAFLDHSEWEVTDAEICGIAAAIRVASDHLFEDWDATRCKVFLDAIANELEAQ